MSGKLKPKSTAGQINRKKAQEKRTSSSATKYVASYFESQMLPSTRTPNSRQSSSGSLTRSQRKTAGWDPWRFLHVTTLTLKATSKARLISAHVPRPRLKKSGIRSQRRTVRKTTRLSAACEMASARPQTTGLVKCRETICAPHAKPHSIANSIVPNA